MCTVVCRWRPGADSPIQLLALRDELASRAFDPPGQWWPEQPGVVGGRDRSAGGTWCASDVDASITAVVLNRPERRLAQPGAASRGALPLLAVKELADWPQHIDVAAMASFNLVLVTPDELRWWSWDGSALTAHRLDEGTYKFTPTRLDSAPAQFAALNSLTDDLRGPTPTLWPAWLSAIDDSEPSDESDALIVSRPVGGDVYETVFGQFIAGRAGTLRLDYAMRPRRGVPWRTELWTAAGSADGSGSQTRSPG